MQKNIFRYILRFSLRQQIVLTLLAVASYPFLYAFYELPKNIVNGAIQGKGTRFPVEILGFSFDQIQYLFLLCGFFLAIVGANQVFKYLINVYKGLTGERMLRRLRYDLYARVLRFPLPHFRKVSPGELIPMITSEVESLGGFIGDAFTQPIYQGGILLVTLTFLFLQNPIMAFAAVALYPVQFYVIPKLQRKVRGFGKERVRLVRRLADRVNETVAGVQEIHTHNTAAYELADSSRRLGGIFEVRMKIYIWKFVIKFINNAANHLGPFFFYSIGGYLVIEGSLDIGTLVAALAAHKELASPWKELLDYYQQMEDAKLKYEQVIEQFEPPGLMEEATLLAEPTGAVSLLGAVVASNLALQDDTGSRSVDGTSFSFGGDSHVALVGASGSGKDETALLLARLMEASAGTLSIANAKLAGLPESVVGRRLAYVGPSAYLFNTSVRDNVLYGLKHRPVRPAAYSDSEAEYWRKWFAEAAAAGNSTDDPNAEWIDYSALGTDSADGLRARVLDALEAVDVQTDVYDFGLRGTIDPALRPDLAARFLEARTSFRESLADPAIAALVEVFDPARYNDNATVGENLLFGTPIGNGFDMEHLAEHPYVLRVLDKAGLTREFLEIGGKVAATMVELFADLPAGHEFFERFSFITSDALPGYQAILARLGRSGEAGLREDERTMLLSLPFKLAPARHRLDLIDGALKGRILAARQLFAADLPRELKASVEFFDIGKYNAAATIRDNILFGKIAYGQARGADRVGTLLAEVIDRLALRPAVMEVGLDFPVGIAGSRLSSAQRQKLALARALLKGPDILILNQATVPLDGASEARVMQSLRELRKGRGIVWVLQRASLARSFDRVIVMRSGKVVAQGSFAELDVDGGPLRELIRSE